MSIIVTEKTCPWCGSEIRKIIGVLVTTEYCANYQCFYFGEVEIL